MYVCAISIVWPFGPALGEVAMGPIEKASDAIAVSFAECYHFDPCCSLNSASQIPSVDEEGRACDQVDCSTIYFLSGKEDNQ